MIRREDLLTAPVTRDIRAHAIREYPKECVGVVVGGEYVPHPNIASDPSRHAQLPRDVVMPLLDSGALEAIVHSHPNGPNCPSEADMRAQIAHEVPFVIVSTNGTATLPPFAWGDMLEPAPLIGRGFMHAVTDCYELIRDEHRSRGIILRPYPRDWEWWLHSKTLYEDNFAREGFVEIDGRDAHDGDCILMAVRSPSGTSNHAAVIVDGDMMLHHMTARLAWDDSRLSKRDPIARWRRYITRFLRKN